MIDDPVFGPQLAGGLHPVDALIFGVREETIMDETTELDIDRIWAESENHPQIMDAIDAASDQDRSTWLTDGEGKRVAAIVPVDVLGSYLESLNQGIPGG